MEGGRGGRGAARLRIDGARAAAPGPRPRTRARARRSGGPGRAGLPVAGLTRLRLRLRRVCRPRPCPPSSAPTPSAPSPSSPPWKRVVAAPFVPPLRDASRPIGAPSRTAATLLLVVRVDEDAYLATGCYLWKVDDTRAGPRPMSLRISASQVLATLLHVLLNLRRLHRLDDLASSFWRPAPDAAPSVRRVLLGAVETLVPRRAPPPAGRAVVAGLLPAAGACRTPRPARCDVFRARGCAPRRGTGWRRHDEPTCGPRKLERCFAELLPRRVSAGTGDTIPEVGRRAVGIP